MTARAPHRARGTRAAASPPRQQPHHGRDLFAASEPTPSAPPQADPDGRAFPPEPVPAYGTLSNYQELRLYADDYPRWTQYVAPRWVELLSTDHGLKCNAPTLRDRPVLKRAVWAIAPPELRQRLTDHFASLPAETEACDG